MQVEAAELMKRIQEGKEIILLDVRTEGEFARGTITGSINIPLDQIESRVKEIIDDKNKSIYTFCLSGSRSMVAVSVMKSLGYTNVSDVKSGLLAWRAAGYSTE